VFKVEEQKPAGTPVILVEAKDLDKGENGEVEYEVLAHMKRPHEEEDRESGPGYKFRS
jgi:hypothetical protein